MTDFYRQDKAVIRGEGVAQSSLRGPTVSRRPTASRVLLGTPDGRAEDPISGRAGTVIASRFGDVGVRVSDSVLSPFPRFNDVYISSRASHCCPRFHGEPSAPRVSSAPAVWPRLRLKWQWRNEWGGSGGTSAGPGAAEETVRGPSLAWAEVRTLEEGSWGPGGARSDASLLWGAQRQSQR